MTISSDGAISVQAGTTLELKGKSGVTIDGGPKVDIDGSVIQLSLTARTDNPARLDLTTEGSDIRWECPPPSSATRCRRPVRST